MKTNAYQSEIVLCGECDTEIYQCANCKEYFIPGNIVYCDDKIEKHTCESCGLNP